MTFQRAQARPTRLSHARALAWFVVLAGSLATSAHAQLRLDITQGVRDAVPIAVVPFGGQAEGGPNDVAAVIAGDLQLSGRFKPLERRDLVARPTRGEQVRFEDWRLLKSDFLVIGHVAPDASGLAVEFELFNVQTGQQLLTKRLVTSERGLRATAHRIADLIFERLTGIPGAFSTRIAYISVDGRPPSQRYRLMVADADGFSPRIVTESSEPIMSPSWSPDGQNLAYVSFEGKASAIYVQRLATGDRRRVSARSGINGAPSWSPDGSRLALTLSRDGNPEIYVLRVADGSLMRLTQSPAIDTEPVWSPDGANIVFTSDRAGGPQLYTVPASGGQAQRLTFEGGYNASADFSPDGRRIAMVHRDAGGSYRIAVYELATRMLRVISDGNQDESPSFAPNGSMVLYASGGGKGTLSMSSVNGRVGQRLRFQEGDVREPAWSPFLPR